MKESRKSTKKNLKTALIDENELEGGTQNDNQIMSNFKNKIEGAADSNIKRGIRKGIKDEEQKEKARKQKPDEVMEARRQAQTRCFFWMYGIIDVIIFGFLAAYEWVHKTDGQMLIAVLVIYCPNILLLLLVMIFDNRSMRNWYQQWLRFKLALQGFILPLIFLAYDESYFEATICSRELASFGVNKSVEEMQKIIDAKDFTLLFQEQNQDRMYLDNLEQTTTVEESPEEQEQKEIAEMKRKIHNAKVILNNKLSPEATREIIALTETADKDKKEETGAKDRSYLTPEQREMKKIQLCATTVVLFSVFLIMFYQIASGHQYFVARRWLMYKETVQKKEEEDRVIFSKDSKKQELFDKGDPDFLLQELERAAEALEKQMNVQRRESEASRGSQKGGFSIN